LPLYEYECPKCGTFELVRKFSDIPLESCPTCARPVEKLASAPAIQFKGTGWYITDYARKSSGREGSKEGKEAKESKDSKESKDIGGAGDSAKSKGEPGGAKGQRRSERRRQSEGKQRSEGIDIRSRQELREEVRSQRHALSALEPLVVLLRRLRPLGEGPAA